MAILSKIVVVVDDEQRKRNSRAVVRLNEWRRRYRALTDAIRASKRRLRDAGSMAEEASERMTLRVLSDRAAGMMWAREDIGIELFETAYRWAPKEMVKQVA